MIGRAAAHTDNTEIMKNIKHVIKSECLLFEIKAASIMLRLFFFFTAHFYCQKGNAKIKLRFHLSLLRNVTLLCYLLLTFSVCLFKNSFAVIYRVT